MAQSSAIKPGPQSLGRRGYRPYPCANGLRPMGIDNVDDERAKNYPANARQDLMPEAGTAEYENTSTYGRHKTLVVIMALLVLSIPAVALWSDPRAMFCGIRGMPKFRPLCCEAVVNLAKSHQPEALEVYAQAGQGMRSLLELLPQILPGLQLLFRAEDFLIALALNVEHYSGLENAHKIAAELTECEIIAGDLGYRLSESLIGIDSLTGTIAAQVEMWIDSLEKETGDLNAGTFERALSAFGLLPSTQWATAATIYKQMDSADQRFDSCIQDVQVCIDCTVKFEAQHELANELTGEAIKTLQQVQNDENAIASWWYQERRHQRTKDLDMLHKHKRMVLKPLRQPFVDMANTLSNLQEMFHDAKEFTHERTGGAGSRVLRHSHPMLLSKMAKELREWSQAMRRGTSEASQREYVGLG